MSIAKELLIKKAHEGYTVCYVDECPLRTNGWTGDVTFDSYVEDYDWLWLKNLLDFVPRPRIELGTKS